MSRHTKVLSPSVSVVFGDDHAIGSFIQVLDIRYAGRPEDTQGEGYVFDWDQLFSISINLIGLELEDFKRKDIDNYIVTLCDSYIKKLDTVAS